MPGRHEAEALAQVRAVTEKHLDRLRRNGKRGRDLAILMAPHNVQRREERMQRMNVVLLGRIMDLEERLETLERQGRGPQA